MRVSIDGYRGESLLSALSRAGIPVDAPCGGSGSCGKCRISRIGKIVQGSALRVEFVNWGGAVPESGPEGIGNALACMSRFKADSSIEIDIEEEDFSVLGDAKALSPGFRPAFTRLRIDLPEPKLSDPGPELSLLSKALAPARLDLSLSSVACLPRLLIEGTRSFDALVRRGACRRLLPRGGKALAAAVDIGTTTLALRLLDADTGENLASAAEPNAQRWAGADVIGRISASEGGEGFERLRDGIRRQVSRLILSMLEEGGEGLDSLCAISVAGNPTMLHFFAGASPSGIARAPFCPVFTELPILPASGILEGYPDSCELLVLPSVSAYVGGDTVAGMLACSFPGATEPLILMDVGTNGEIALACDGRILCCSAAAGPAFEGASIECGCPSISGAIDSVTLRGAEVAFTTIGGAPARGICGSGLLDAIALLLELGYVDSTGRFTGNRIEFIIDAGGGTRITQADIRQVQLAKAAMAAGLKVLLAEAGLSPADVGKVYLSGGFGSRLKAQSALRIGLLDRGFQGKIEAVGNSSLSGAIAAAVEEGAWEGCLEIAGRARAIELSGLASFSSFFAEEMLFPE